MLCTPFLWLSRLGVVTTTLGGAKHSPSSLSVFSPPESAAYSHAVTGTFGMSLSQAHSLTFGKVLRDNGTLRHHFSHSTQKKRSTISTCSVGRERLRAAPAVSGPRQIRPPVSTELVRGTDASMFFSQPKSVLY